MKTFEKAKDRQEYLFTEMASLLGVLASPVRLKIIHFLFQAPHSVEPLSIKIGQSVANTSMHLKKMQRENILKTVVLGQKRVYSLAQEEMREFWEQIQHFAEIHNSSNIISSPDIYHEELAWPRDFVETIKMIQSKKLVLLDVRPSDEIDESDPFYNEFVTHIPAENLKKETHLIPTKKPILVICRGRLCVMSNESTFLLRKKGFEVYKFDYSWYQISKMIGKSK